MEFFLMGKPAFGRVCYKREKVPPRPQNEAGGIKVNCVGLEGNLRHRRAALHEIEVACGENQLGAGAACHALIHHRAREGVFSQKSLKIRALSKKA